MLSLRGRAFLLILAAGPFDPATLTEPPPAPTRLEERTSAELVQIELAVEGPQDVIASLRARDFSLTVAGRSIPEFTIDRICNTPSPGSPGGEPGAEHGTPPVARNTPSYLFFFDLTHMTLDGRHIGIATARDLIDRLVRDGARAAIVASGRKLETLVPLTTDRARLAQTLGALAGDITRAADYAALEDGRVLEIKRLLAEDPLAAKSLARSYAREEWWEARHSEQRLSLALGMLAGEPAPRGAFYFSDILRQAAGVHYLALVGESDFGMQTSSELEFNRVIRDALVLGVHLFPVQAAGMTEGSDEAENTLVSLGIETGGEGFIRGIGTAKIADRIHEQFDCLYLLSFKPAGLPVDRPLSVDVRTRKPGVKIRRTGQIVIPSATTRHTTSLLAAFSTDASDDASSGFAVSLVFLSGDKKGYHALAQVRAPPSLTERASWDLGASLIAKESLRDDFSARITASSPKAPVVLEKPVTLKAGPYEIVAVGDLNGSRVLSSRIAGTLAPPGDVALSPVAVIQESAGAFARDGATRTRGSVAIQESEPVDGRKPVALVSVVCRDAGTEPATVTRSLRGRRSIEFDPIGFGKDRCIQVRDVVPPGTLAPGNLFYEIQVRRGDAILGSGEKSFSVAAVSASASPAARAEPHPPR